ncbi:MAG: hypothetical protein Q9220_003736 [cf. Caloplaca sp. 1 TL-2023]
MLFFFIWMLASLFYFSLTLAAGPALYLTDVGLDGLEESLTASHELQRSASEPTHKVASSPRKRVEPFSAEDHDGSSSAVFAKRSLVDDFSSSALHFIFLQADVIVSSALAYYQTTDFYRNMTALLGTGFHLKPTAQTIVLTYGALKLTASYAQRQALADTLLLKVLARFAEYMLDTLALVVVGAYRVGVQVKQDIFVWIGMDADDMGA